MKRQDQYILFLPNGIGDTIMASFAIETLPPDAQISKIVTLGPIHSDFFRRIASGDISILERFDGGRFSQLRLWLKLFFSPEKRVVAPLISKKYINYLFFFSLFNKKILSPNGFSKITWLNISNHKYNLNSFDGHQVNYIRSFFNCEKEQEPPPSVCLTRTDDQPYKVAIGLSCGVAERHKIPSPKWFAEVINIVKNQLDISVTLIGTKGDLPLIEQFEQHLTREIRIEKHIGLPLNLLLEKISECHIGFAGTTGQSHIMSLTNIPQAVVCGVTNPCESGPFIGSATLITHNLKCGPCYQDGFQFGCRKIDCMNNIHPSIGAQKVIELLRNPKKFERWLSTTKIKTKSTSEIQRIHNVPI